MGGGPAGRAAADALVRLGARAAPALGELLDRCPAPAARREVLRALGRIGGPVAAEVLAAEVARGAEEGELARALAATADDLGVARSRALLARLGASPVPSVSAVARRLLETSDGEAPSAGRARPSGPEWAPGDLVWTAEQADGDAAAAVRRVARGRLEDVDPAWRAAALDALGLVGRRADLDPALAGLRDEPAVVRRRAAAALAAHAVPADHDRLVELLRSADDATAAQAAWGLLRLADARARPALRSATARAGSSTAVNAGRALEVLDGATSPAGSSWVAFQARGADGRPVPSLRASVTLANGMRLDTHTDADGVARLVGVVEGPATVRFHTP